MKRVGDDEFGGFDGFARSSESLRAPPQPSARKAVRPGWKSHRVCAESIPAAARCPRRSARRLGENLLDPSFGHRPGCGDPAGRPAPQSVACEAPRSVRLPRSIAAFRLLRRINQAVGHAAHRRNHSEPPDAAWPRPPQFGRYAGYMPRHRPTYRRISLPEASAPYFSSILSKNHNRCGSSLRTFLAGMFQPLQPVTRRPSRRPRFVQTSSREYKKESRTNRCQRMCPPG